jgi:hypothetical protein
MRARAVKSMGRVLCRQGLGLKLLMSSPDSARSKARARWPQVKGAIILRYVVVMIAVCSSSLGVRLTRASPASSAVRSFHYSLALEVAAGTHPAVWIRASGQPISFEGPQNDLLMRNTGNRIPHLVLWLESFGTWSPRRIVSFVQSQGTTRRLRPTRVKTVGTFVYSPPWDTFCAHRLENPRPYAWDLGSIEKGAIASVAIGIAPSRPYCWDLSLFGFWGIDSRGGPDVRTAISGAQANAKFHARVAF